MNSIPLPMIYPPWPRVRGPSGLEDGPLQSSRESGQCGGPEESANQVRWSHGISAMETARNRARDDLKRNTLVLERYNYFFFLKDFKKAAYSSGVTPAFVNASMVLGSFIRASIILGVSS